MLSASYVYPLHRIDKPDKDNFQYLPMFTFCNGYFYNSTTIF